VILWDPGPELIEFSNRLTFFLTIHRSSRRKGTGSKTWASAENGWKRGRLGE
jgi:hypothetical protein